MNIHILPDDKYVETYVEFAEKCSLPGSNVYLVRDAKPFRYLKGNYNYIEALVGSKIFNDYVNAAGKDDKIFLHFISMPVKNWLADFETSARIGWVYWGNDFYTNMLPYFNHFDPLTQAYFDAQEPKTLSRFWLLSEYRMLKRKIERKRIKKRHLEQSIKAAAKLTWVFHWMTGDFERIQEYLKCPAEFFYFGYPLPTEIVALDKMVLTPQPLENVPYPKKIWVGNCGYPWVNHIDSFELIKNTGDDVAVCVPLSYGDKEYTKYVVKEGEKRFGARFITYNEYMSFEDFVKTLYNMDLTIMGHNTPWAVGNIMTMMYFGRRAFIKPDLPSFRWFKEKGLFVENYYSFDPIKAFEPVDIEIVEKNKQIIREGDTYKHAKDTITRMLEL